MERGLRRLRFGIEAILMVAAAAAAAEAFGIEVEDLYRAETVVTGRGAPERRRGFAVGFEEVLVKLTGDANVVQRDGVRQLLPRAAAFVAHYEYEDRMKGVPIHDEQGTRERPHYLRMTFDAGAMEEVLRRLGLASWSSDRPRVMIWLGIRDSVRAYVLDTAIEFGFGQREALASASKRRGVPIVLPNPSSGLHAIAYDDIAAGDVGRLRQASGPYRADAILHGTLVMDDNGYWTLAWSLLWKNRTERARLEGVTFDVALRTALEEAARRFAAAQR